jgi:hypothetical protein
VHAIDRSGGTVLLTSRTQPSNMRATDLPVFLRTTEQTSDDVIDCTDHVLSVFKALDIDVLIAIGGDDTLSYAAHIHGEGMPTIFIPKTMDNDVYGTEYCVGYSTYVTRSVELIDRLRTPVGSHERFLVVELFGRNCGQTALMAGYLAGPIERSSPRYRSILTGSPGFCSTNVKRTLPTTPWWSSPRAHRFPAWIFSNPATRTHMDTAGSAVSARRSANISSRQPGSA